ncbi:MAG: hypothetical protein ACREO2_09325, partial [Arenimonas sp.]
AKPGPKEDSMRFLVNFQLARESCKPWLHVAIRWTLSILRMVQETMLPALEIQALIRDSNHDANETFHRYQAIPSALQVPSLIRVVRAPPALVFAPSLMNRTISACHQSMKLVRVAARVEKKAKHLFDDTYPFFRGKTCLTQRAPTLMPATGHTTLLMPLPLIP